MAASEQPVPPARPSATVTPWAIAALFFSIAGCFSPLAIIFGLRALVQVNANPHQRGRRLAWAGIAIGVVTTAGWISGLVWWHFHARLPMLHGPREALQAGFNDDLAAFRDAFHGAGANAADEQARGFIAALRERYGGFQDSFQSATPRAKAAMAGPAELTISYTLQFERQSVEADAAFMTFAPSQILPNPVFKWRWIRVLDPQRGDLVYPVQTSSP